VAGELSHVLRRSRAPGSGDCSPNELEPVAACLESMCGSFEGVERTACAQAACGSEVAALRGGCLGCILNSLDASLETCAGDGSAPDDPAIFGGAYDEVLLARYPFETTEITPLDGYLVRTAVLYARVATPELGPVHVFCTHLGSPLGVIPYTGPHGSWEGEHAAQVDALVELVATKSSDGLPTLMLGDLNMGPAVGASVAVLDEHYEKLLAVGLTNPYASRAGALCTDCADNAFHALETDYDDSLIDHVLAGGISSYFWTAERVLDEPLDVGGVPLNLSDHYGVKLTLAGDR